MSLSIPSVAMIIPGSDTPIRAHFTGSGRRIALKVNGTGAMQIEGILLGAEVCGV